MHRVCGTNTSALTKRLFEMNIKSKYNGNTHWYWLGRLLYQSFFVPLSDISFFWKKKSFFYAAELAKYWLCNFVVHWRVIVCFFFHPLFSFFFSDPPLSSFVPLCAFQLFFPLFPIFLSRGSWFVVLHMVFTFCPHFSTPTTNHSIEFSYFSLSSRANLTFVYTYLDFGFVSYFISNLIQVYQFSSIGKGETGWISKSHWKLLVIVSSSYGYGYGYDSGNRASFRVIILITLLIFSIRLRKKKKNFNFSDGNK